MARSSITLEGVYIVNFASGRKTNNFLGSRLYAKSAAEVLKEP
jgi:hypothetical protein